ncbi:MAG: hypothetical protein AAF806_02460, partial [Bacteroidota bacterium]
MFVSDSDFKIAWSIITKERKTKIYAEYLGITGLTKEEQKHIVKKNKDRIKKVLLRNNWGEFL